MTPQALPGAQPLRNSAWLLLSHGRSLWRVTRNDVAARYAGSLLGTAWLGLSPLIILAVYAVIYVAVFQIKAPGLSTGQYVLYIFAGLVPYLATSEAIAVGIGSVVAGKSVLNNTVFPIDLVPAKAVLTSQGTLFVGLAVILAGVVFTGRASWTLLLVPVLVVLHAACLLGIVWVLSLLNVVFRDLQGLVNLFLMVMLIGSPIAYTPEMVPAKLAFVLLLNPFAYLVMAYQKLLVLGQLPSLFHILVLVGFGLGTFFAGGWFFARTKRVIVDYV